MTCKITQVRDPKLAKLVKTMGVEPGATEFLKEYAHLKEDYESSTPISGEKVVEKLNALGAENATKGTAHRLEVKRAGKMIDLSKVSISVKGFYTTRVIIDWGSQIEDKAPLYSAPIDPEEIGPGEFDPEDGSPMFDDEGTFGGNEFFDPEDAMGGPMEPDDVASEELGSLILVDEMTRGQINPDELGFTVKTPMQARVVRVAKALLPKIEQMRKRIGVMYENINKIERNIQAMLERGVDKNSPEIMAEQDRMTSITAKIHEYRGHIETMAASIVKMRKTASAEDLKAMFLDHKKFVDFVAAMQDPDEGDLVLAYSALNMWSGLTSMLADNLGTMDADIIAVSDEILGMANGVSYFNIRRHIRNVILGKHSKRLRRKLTEEAISYGVDVNTLTKWSRSAGDTSNSLLTLIQNFISEAAFKTNNEFHKVKNEVNHIFDDLSKSGLSLDKFLEKDDKGEWTGNLIGRYRKDYHAKMSQVNDEFEKSVKKANEVDTSTREGMQKRNAILVDAIATKNSVMRSISIMIDPNSIKFEADRVKVIADLTAQIGDETYAKQLVDDAYAKNERFDRDFGMIQSYYLNRVFAKTMTAEDAKAKINSFFRHNSPKSYYEYIHKSKGDLETDIRTIGESIEKYVTIVPRRTFAGTGQDTKFYNDSFNEIMNNPAARKFYYAYTNKMQQMLSHLPGAITRKKDATFLPNIQKDFLQRVSTGGMAGFFNGVQSEIVEAVTSDETADSQYGRTDENGKIIRSIPVRFMKEIATKDKSQDLKAILMHFSEMAIGYKHLSQVEDKVQLDFIALQGMEEAKRNKDGSFVKKNGSIDTTGRRLEETIKMAQHTIDANIYGSSKDIEGVTSVKFFDKSKNSIKITGSVPAARLLKEFQELKDKHGAEIAAKKMKETYPDNVIIVTERQAYKDLQQKLWEIEDEYSAGKIDKSTYKIRVAEIEEAMSKLGRNNVIGKWVDGIIKFAAYKAFAWNPFPVITNQSFGIVTIYNHATSGLDFTTSDATFGITSAFASSAKSVSLAATENDVVYQLAKKLGLIADITENISGESRGLMSLFGPFGLLASSDYVNRSAVMMAVLKSTKINDLTGKERSLIEAFNSDGTWNVAEFGQNDQYNGDFNIEGHNIELFRLTEKVRSINRFLHGNMDRVTQPEAKRHALGRLLAQFRLSWMAEGFATRVEEMRWDDTLGRDTEGRYRTAVKYFSDNGFAGSIDTLLKLALFQKDVAFNGKRISPEHRELVIANMRKNFHELMMWATMTGVYLLLSASVDDDDENKSAKYMALNSINRIIGDITFYCNPSTFDQIWSNPFPALSIFNDALRFSKTVTKFMNGDDYYDEEVLLENFTRMFPGLNVYNKIKYRSEQILNN